MAGALVEGSGFLKESLKGVRTLDKGVRGRSFSSDIKRISQWALAPEETLLDFSRN
jgi:hypothetical protein